MREPGLQIASALPIPGKALRGVLIVIAVFAVVGAIVVNWAPGPPLGGTLFTWLTFPTSLGDLKYRPWTLLTSGLLTSPRGISHALYSLLGLYFLTTDLEKRWGGRRLIRFLLIGTLVSNLTVFLGSLIPVGDVFQPGVVFGPLGAITACVIAWSIENKERQIRFMFFIPMSGRTLFWVTIGMAILGVLFAQSMHEGALAPFGGIATGILFGGTPSRARSAWLRLRLRLMGRGNASGLTVESLTGERFDRARSAKRSSGKTPALRVVQGGFEDDLKNRKPPKDKRFLN